MLQRQRLRQSTRSLALAGVIVYDPLCQDCVSAHGRREIGRGRTLDLSRSPIAKVSRLSVFVTTERTVRRSRPTRPTDLSHDDAVVRQVRLERSRSLDLRKPQSPEGPLLANLTANGYRGRTGTGTRLMRRLGRRAGSSIEKGFSTDGGTANGLASSAESPKPMPSARAA